MPIPGVVVPVPLIPGGVVPPVVGGVTVPPPGVVVPPPGVVAVAGQKLTNVAELLAQTPAWVRSVKLGEVDEWQPVHCGVTAGTGVWAGVWAAQKAVTFLAMPLVAQTDCTGSAVKTR